MAIAMNADETIELLNFAWRVNLANMQNFKQRLDRLADVGHDLKSGQCSSEVALERAEALGFVAPLRLTT